MNAVDHSQRVPPVLILAHAHYAEIWDELAERLKERVTIPFNLIVTTSHREARLARPDTPALRDMRVITVENRGRDILPFLRALSQAGPFDIGLKLHTKKSPQRTDGSAWRTQLYDALLPPAGGVSELVKAMRADPRIGLVAPDGFSLSVRPWVFINAAPMAAVMSALGHDLVDGDMDDAFFAAGSMFWFRYEALVKLTDPALPALFEPEQGQLDGTIAHGLERLFPVEARRQGFISTTIAALEASKPGHSSVDLLSAARAHSDIPNVYFPAPGVAAGSPTDSPAAGKTQRRYLARLASLLKAKRGG